jgi:predicted O-methyltransferase YrrM
MPSDINEHLDTLRGLARECSHVTEFGTRAGVSTTALLDARPKVLVSYDIDRLSVVAVLEEVARGLRCTQFIFRQANVLEVEIEDTDLLFIDTWHVYDQLKEESTTANLPQGRWVR